MKDEFDLDIKVKVSSDNDIEPQTATPIATSSAPCINAIIASIRFCTRITCKGCF